MKSRHFVSIASTPLEDLLEIFDVTARQKQALAREGRLGPILEGKTLGMLFEKPSLRTRVSFEVAMAQLGGHTTTLGQGEVQLGQREAVCDFARVLCRYVDVIAARVFQHRHVEEMARNSRVAVINALSDYSHPCQALADLWTFQRALRPVGRRSSSRSSATATTSRARSGSSAPSSACGSRWPRRPATASTTPTSKSSRARRRTGSSSSRLGSDPRKLLRGADAVYTDVWASMGQEAEREKRKTRIRALPAQRETAPLRQAGRHRPPLPAGASRRGDHRRRDGRPAGRRLRPGGKPDAHRARAAHAPTKK